MQSYIKHLVLVSFSMIGMLFKAVEAQEIREFMDLQAHATMHVPYPFFGKGLSSLQDRKEPKLTYRHQFTNVVYADYYKNNQGSRILINGAMAAEVAFTKKRATRLISNQIDYINEFAKNNAEYFVVAKTPIEVREAILKTNKTVIIHSIEGARRLIEGPEDAEFWAKKGVAFITLIHLQDGEFGNSAITPDGITPLINLGGTLGKHFHSKDRRGLTELGKQSIVWLADAGIMTDLSHMHPDSVDDAMDVMDKEGIPPLHTHSQYRPLHNHDRGLTDQQIIRTYKMGGLFSLPISGESLKFYKPTEEGKKIIDKQTYCEGSVDNYTISLKAVDSLLKSNAGIILGLEKPTVPYADLSEQQKTQLGLGWQSDFNGWTNHSRPRFGKRGCYPAPQGETLSQLELIGLAHPGMLPEYWSAVEKDGGNIDGLKRSSEKFLQMWEKILKRANKN